MIENNEHIRAVAYTRVSTKKEEQDKSYQNQKEYYKFFCEEKGYKLIETYADKGSGTNSSRKGFLTMLFNAGIDATPLKGGKDYDYTISDKRNPLFDLIICKDTSRFARNASEGMTLVKRLRKLGVHILFEGRNKNTEDADNYDEINQWFVNGEGESRTTSRRIKTTFRYKREMNIYPSGALPYALYRDEQGDIYVNEEQGNVVKEVFTLAKTMGCRRIANILNEKGYSTTTGTKWGYSQVNTMLKNTLYYGTATSGKTETGALTENPKPVPKEHQKEIPNQAPAIISKGDFDQVQKILLNRSSNKAGTKRGTNIPKDEDIFSKKIKCAKCGGAYTRAKRKYTRKNGEIVEFYYYYCLTRNRAKVCDNSRHVPFTTLKKVIAMVNPMIILGEKTQDKRILKTIEQAKEKQNEIELDYLKEITENKITIDEKMGLLGKLKIDNVIEQVESEINVLIEKNKLLRLKIDKLKIVNLDGMVQRVEERVAEMERMSKSLTDEDKLNLVKEIKVNDYEYTFTFDVPNFNDIINELNSFMNTHLAPSTYFEDMFNTFTVREVNKQLELVQSKGGTDFF